MYKIGTHVCQSHYFTFKTNQLHLLIVVVTDQTLSSASINTSNSSDDSLSLSVALKKKRAGSSVNGGIKKSIVANMGNCVPVGKNTDSALKLKCSIKSEGNGFLIESPVKDTIVSDDRSMVALNSSPQSSSRKPRESSFRDMSNREMYFDSQPWLESDCEDYESVNGDFTTSQGTSPTRQCSSLVENAPQNESLPINTTANTIIPEACPTEPKKQLIELFSESFKGETVDENTNLQDAAVSKPTIVNLPPTCTNGSPYECAGNSFSGSKTTPNSGKEKSGYSAQRCLPNLGRSLSLGERKRKLSPRYVCGK